MQPGIPFDTTNVLFICCGAFVRLKNMIAEKLGRGDFRWLNIARYPLIRS
jgi:ATP-dependent protease Clp ATPase subunit